MIGHKKILHRVPAEQLTFLKPQKLGRHYHKVPAYIKELIGKYPKVISDYVLTHYRINMDLCDVRVDEHFSGVPECRYRSTIGKIGFSIDRPLLTELLESYYGGTTLPSQDAPPVSTSEDRMRERLGVDIAKLCARMMLGGVSLEHIDASVSAYEEVHWGYRVELRYRSQASGCESSICLYLDGAVGDELTRRLTDAHPPTAAEPTVHRIHELPVQLDCILAIAQMPLASVLALQLDDILVMRLLDRCEVHIGQQKLFHGAISESDGSLFLTSMDSVKSQ
ncbi:hypothetical protein PS627_00133 [Pseudomonas fluorescens]|uniref:FliM/FliN family flagellar motor switch protein n=1 Tax=Pseudomonas fluorescens TaxID=294 RepID=UPI00125215FC|nr:FliM/FliN family flagellar motor switch protein [Pseudomonas fluorescens]CAG8863197.1 hypothetical protein PS627_00133 [Pseudomonas fluorescens]VVP69030.1 hypothetical protein PS910_00493 [Pseudomonas fluorescens]